MVLANPPFKGAIDATDVNPTLPVKCKKTEILFLHLFLRCWRMAVALPLSSPTVGPSASELGLMFGDFFRVRRLRRAVRLLSDVKQIASEAGLTLKAVAPRLLLPILESASLQEDEDLHQRWVALLTNAATTDYDNQILPCFPDMLKQLTSEEAQFLDRAYEEVTNAEKKQSADTLRDHTGEPPQPVRISGDTLRSLQPVMLGNLERLMVVTRNSVPLSTEEARTNTFSHANHLYLSELGKAFVRACHVPKQT